jgi:hypothetical protein
MAIIARQKTKTENPWREFQPEKKPLAEISAAEISDERFFVEPNRPAEPCSICGDPLAWESRFFDGPKCATCEPPPESHGTPKAWDRSKRTLVGRFLVVDAGRWVILDREFCESVE